MSIAFSVNSDGSFSIRKRRGVTTDLYRHYAKDGTLLYVGISFSALARLIQHRRSARWYRRIASVRIKKFPTREAAEAAEKIAIEKEKPLFNIINGSLECRPTGRKEPSRPRRPEVIPFAEWCKMRGISVSTGRRLIAIGKVKVTRLSERRIGIRSDHDLEYLDSCLQARQQRVVKREIENALSS